MARVVWRPSVPAEVRAAAEPMLGRWLWVLPPWLYELTVNWDEPQKGEAPGSAAVTEATEEYRFGAVSLRPEWLMETPAQRERHLLHELVHMLFARTDAAHLRCLHYVRRTSRKVVHEELEESARLALEGAVSDLTEVLMRERGD